MKNDGKARNILLFCVFFLLTSCPQSSEAPTGETLGVYTHRFLALGDAGTGESGQLQVAGAMKAFLDREKTDFILLLRDNIYPSGVTSGDDPQWASNYELVYGIWNLPVYAVLGNHDYGGGAGANDAVGIFQIEHTSISSTWKMPAASYSFQAGSADFFALDTNWIKRHQGNDAGQGTLVDAWLAKASGWKILFGHHPYLSNGVHGNAGAYDGSLTGTGNGLYFKNFFQDHLLGKADLYLCGHDHDLQVLAPAAGSPLLVVSGGGGGDLRSLPGINPTQFQKVTWGFTAVDYNAAELRVRIFDQTGTLLYTRTLRK